MKTMGVGWHECGHRLEAHVLRREQIFICTDPGASGTKAHCDCEVRLGKEEEGIPGVASVESTGRELYSTTPGMRT